MSRLSPRRDRFYWPSPALDAAGVVGCGLIVLMMSLSLRAADFESPSIHPEVAQRIASLLPELDAEKFSDRQAATDALQQLGKAAFGALADAAASSEGEARTRALNILRHHFQQGDNATSEAARQALEKVADGSGPAARIARGILEPLPAEPDLHFQGRRVLPAAVRGRAIQIQMQAQMGNGARINRMQVKQVGNTRTTEVEQDKRKMKIVEQPGKIEVEVTEPAAEGPNKGKLETKKYEAKDVDELKKKHPEAYKVYQQHAQKMQQFRIQIRGANAPPAPVPPAPVPPVQRQQAQLPQAQGQQFPARQLIPAGQANDRLKAHYNRIIQTLEQQEQRLKQQLADRPEVLKRQLEALAKHRERIVAMRERLEEKLAERQPAEKPPAD